MTEVVLDASAVIALLRSEPGAEQVAGMLGHSVLSTVNLAEILTKIAEYGKPPPEVAHHLARLQIPNVPFDQAQAMLAASLRETTRVAGLSLGDRACLALAQRLGVPAITTNTAWKRVNVGIPVQYVR